MGGRLAKGRILRTTFLISLATCFLAQSAIADEVDDILALKAKNRDRIKSYSAEYVVDTKLPKDRTGTAKTARMRYRLRMERLPKDKAKGLLNPWKTEIDVLEPYAMSLRIEGERIWFKKGDEWAEQEMAAQKWEQFKGMSERYLGADPAEQKQRFDIRLLRRNNSIFGLRTKTLEYTAKGIAHLAMRMQEDVSAEGVPLETRLYDDADKQNVVIRILAHHRQMSVLVIDRSESIVRSPKGEIHTVTTRQGQIIQLQDNNR